MVDARNKGAAYRIQEKWIVVHAAYKKIAKNRESEVRGWVLRYTGARAGGSGYFVPTSGGWYFVL